uniref:Transmembrane p24 trafficking protein 5 n=1 Tax=Paramormyrops kingsleyae TaxID=1676925 RepID=A0A3B3S6M2_9TELE
MGAFAVLAALFVSVSVAEVGAAFSQSLDSDFTFTLPAGRKECFFQTMRKDASLEIEYQVLDGAGLDVDFSLSSPSGHVLARDHRKSDGVHTVETDDGDYMFCFDNTFSTVSEKIIFFELILDNMEDVEGDQDWKEYVHGTDLLDMKLEDIMVTEVETPLLFSFPDKTSNQAQWLYSRAVPINPSAVCVVSVHGWRPCAVAVLTLPSGPSDHGGLTRCHSDPANLPSVSTSLGEQRIPKKPAKSAPVRTCR